MTYSTARLFAAASLMALGTTLGLPAEAQQRAGGDGRALDANQQVGSGGVNRIEGQVDYRARNDLITGNVSGGRGFRGQIDYAAPQDFRSGLGTDTLFDFRAQSLPSSPLISDPARGAAMGLRSQGIEPLSVYRSFSSSGGMTAPSGMRAVALDGGSRGIFSASQVRGSMDALNTLGGSTQQLPGDQLGAQRREDGGTTVFSSSPLLGVRRTELPPPVSPFESDMPAPRAPRPVEPEDPLLSTPDLGLGTSSRVEGQRVGQTAGSITILPSIEAGATPPGLIIGQQLQSLVSAQRAGETLDQRVERLEQMIMRRTDPAVSRPGSEVYRDLMAQMREAQADLAQRPQMQPLDAGLTEVEEAKVSEAERIAAEALRRAYGVYGRPEDDPAKTRAEGEEPADPQAVPESVTRLLDQLRREVPRLESLAADAEDRANVLMRQAEQKMVAGEFFDADALYRQAKAVAPDNPLATVGMVHAQMGAGMIRTASFNLRQLFEKHPELINVRYDAALLPSKERLQWLQGELQRMIDAGDFAAEPGLVLAYLGHQTHSRQLIRYGLAVSEARNPRDPLMNVLRGVWLGDGEEAKD